MSNTSSMNASLLLPSPAAALLADPHDGNTSNNSISDAEPLSARYGATARDAKPPSKRRRIGNNGAPPSISLSPTSGFENKDYSSTDAKTVMSAPQAELCDVESELYEPSSSSSRSVDSAPSSMAVVSKEQQDETTTTSNIDADVDVPLPAEISVTVPKSVRFETMAMLALIERDSRDVSVLKWHSPEDKEEGLRTLRTDARSMMAKLANTPLHTLDKDEMYNCVGIENLLSRNIFMRVNQEKANHRRAILMAHRHGRSAEELSMISERSSSWCRERSAAIAAGYMSLN